MSNIVVFTHLTLDGVMQAPGRREEDRRGGFAHGGWARSNNDSVIGSVIGAGMAKGGGLLLGRRTYEDFAAFWPNQPQPRAPARRLEDDDHGCGDREVPPGRTDGRSEWPMTGEEMGERQRRLLTFLLNLCFCLSTLCPVFCHSHRKRLSGGCGHLASAFARSFQGTGNCAAALGQRQFWERPLYCNDVGSKFFEYCFRTSAS
jgi:hypothetical protein